MREGNVQNYVQESSVRDELVARLAQAQADDDAAHSRRVVSLPDVSVIGLESPCLIAMGISMRMLGFSGEDTPYTWMGSSSTRA
jgi:hypothetical protein